MMWNHCIPCPMYCNITPHAQTFSGNWQKLNYRLSIPLTPDSQCYSSHKKFLPCLPSCLHYQKGKKERKKRRGCKKQQSSLDNITKCMVITYLPLTYLFSLQMIDLAKQGDEETINSWITVSWHGLVMFLLYEGILLQLQGRGRGTL